MLLGWEEFNYMKLIVNMLWYSCDECLNVWMRLIVNYMVHLEFIFSFRSILPNFNGLGFYVILFWIELCCFLFKISFVYKPRFWNLRQRSEPTTAAIRLLPVLCGLHTVVEQRAWPLSSLSVRPALLPGNPRLASASPRALSILIARRIPSNPISPHVPLALPTDFYRTPCIFLRILDAPVGFPHLDYSPWHCYVPSPVH